MRPPAPHHEQREVIRALQYLPERIARICDPLVVHEQKYVIGLETEAIVEVSALDLAQFQKPPLGKNTAARFQFPLEG